MKTVILPEKNRKDLVDVPKKALSDLNILFVKNMDEVLDGALLPKEAKPKKDKKEKKVQKTSSTKPSKTQVDENKPPVQPGV